MRRPRRSDIDALRVTAVALVLVVHAAMVYSPWQTWHVQNDVRSPVLGQLTLFPGPWLMALFMLLAGRSAFYSLEHRTDRWYLGERVTRLFIPLVAGTLLLVPPMMYVRRTLEGRFDGGFVDFYPHFFAGLYPQGNLSWGHLWFLAYLLIYSVLLLPLLRAVKRRHAKRPVRQPGLLILAFVAFGIGGQLALRAPYPQTNGLVNDWANHAQLVPAFLLGYMLAMEPALEATVDRVRHFTVIVAIISSIALGVLVWPGAIGDRGPTVWSAVYVAFWTAAGIATWAWLLAITAFARRFLATPTGWLDRYRAAVYPFYILHQPVLVLVAFYLVPIRMPVFAEFALLLLCSLAVTLAACELAGRWRPAKLLLGMRPVTAMPRS